MDEQQTNLDEQQTHTDPQESLPADESAPVVESQTDESPAEPAVTAAESDEFDWPVSSNRPADEALAESVEDPEDSEDSEDSADAREVAEAFVDAQIEDDAQSEAGETEAFREPAALVEAILFTTDSPLPAARMSQIAQLPGVKIVRQAVRDLNEKYERMGCSFRIEEIGGGYQMMTLPEYHDVLGRLSKTRGDNKLSQAGLEALAIIAYRQPILRADIEAIRGVASGEILRTLMEKQLVKIVGRAEVIGRPMLYGTTRRFLDVFGLGSLEDLPRVEELKAPRDAFKSKPASAASESAVNESVAVESAGEAVPAGEGSPAPDSPPVAAAQTDETFEQRSEAETQMELDSPNDPPPGVYCSDAPDR